MPSNIASYSARRVGSACVVLAAAAAARPVVRAGGTNVFVSDADAQDGLRCLLGVVQAWPDGRLAIRSYSSV